MKFSNKCRVQSGIALIGSVIDLKNLLHPLSQLDAKQSEFFIFVSVAKTDSIQPFK